MELSSMSYALPDEFDIIDAAPAPRWRRAVGSVRDNLGKIAVLTLLLLFVVVYLAPAIFITVRSGEVGVMYLRFFGGTQTSKVLGEGLKIVAPWDTLFIYNVRVQEAKHEMDVLTTEGLTVRLNLSIRYHPEEEMVGLLHQKVGPDYRDTIVIPEVESALRTIMGAFTMRDVYSSERGLVQKVINDSLEHVSQKFVKVDSIVLRNVELPSKLRQTVEDKMAQKELAESYEYRIDVERKEADRKLIEANGTKQYNDVLNSSLTPSVLRWRGIEATEALAKSSNAKTVVIGKADGLPLIMNPEK
jgi:regulator of protease activity HflC (stomatin/prohibitin superfamily)